MGQAVPIFFLTSYLNCLCSNFCPLNLAVSKHTFKKNYTDHKMSLLSLHLDWTKDWTNPIFTASLHMVCAAAHNHLGGLPPVSWCHSPTRKPKTGHNASDVITHNCWIEGNNHFGYCLGKPLAQFVHSSCVSLYQNIPRGGVLALRYM